MFLDESAFDLEDEDMHPSSSSRSSHKPPSSSYSNNNSNSNNNYHNGSSKNNNRDQLALVLDDDMDELSLGGNGGGLGSAGGIGASSASRARFLAQQRELTLKKQQQKMSQSGMVRSSIDSPLEPSGQFTPSIRQFSAPKAVREVESDFSRQSQSRTDTFSPTEKTSSRSRRALEEEEYEAPKSRGTDRKSRDRVEDRRQPTTRGEDYDDYDRRKGKESSGGRGRGEGGRRNPEGWIDEDRDDYDRRKDKYKRRDDDYEDYGRDTRSSRGGGRGESRRGETDRRRGKDEGSSDEERYRRSKNRSRSPPPSRSTRRDDYDDYDDRRREKGRDERGKERSKRRDDYDDDYERGSRAERDRERGGRKPKFDEEEDRDIIDKKGKSSARGAGWNEREREMASGDEDSEAPEKWAAVGREREGGVVGPGSRLDRSTGPPPSMPSVELDLSDMTRFLMRPLPRGAGIVQCHIVRNKSGTHKLYPIYSLYLKDNDRFLMCSKKRPNNKTSNYLISKKENDLARESPNYLGKLRSNFVGTEFQVFDNGMSPEHEEGGHDTRRELGAITYAPNVLGSRGPRKMQAVIPAVDESNTIVSWRQEKGSEGEMLQRIKDRNFKDLCYLINKPPRWNEQVGAYVLNFSGRVTMASVKNFQLVDPDEQNAIILQFGRVGKDQFTMDMQWPMSPFQAFAITLSSFDSKIACD